MVRMRSRSMDIWSEAISPVLVRTNALNGICNRWVGRCVREEKRRETHKNVFPGAVGAGKVEPVLPEVRGDGSVRLDVHEVRVARAWVAAGAHA